MNIKNKKILVTGASFIGVHLIEALIAEKPSAIRVVNLTDKHKKNIRNNSVEFYARDLRDLSKATKSVRGMDIVIHLAADHGGRGYVATKQGNTASNLLLDGSVFRASLTEGVEKIFYASSGCVYPNFLQQDIRKRLLLKEDSVKPPYDSDNMYGWAKLMGELTLKHYFTDYKMKSAVGRFFTVYGPYASESHAVMATIAKAFVRQDPFEVWGDGRQIRNWTYVTDISRGIIRALKRIDDATPVNLGTTERNSVNDMVHMTFKAMGYEPKKIRYTDMPTGPLNRVADISRAKKLLGWEPLFTLKQGLAETADWYKTNKKAEYVRANLTRLLMHD